MSRIVKDLNERLNGFARVDLGCAQTPIDPLHRLGDRLGIGKGHKVLFIHTGGTPALFAYQTDVMAGLNTGETTA